MPQDRLVHKQKAFNEAIAVVVFSLLTNLYVVFFPKTFNFMCLYKRRKSKPKKLRKISAEKI